ncbi:translation initiation factor IF-2 [bacterium]|nr:translation initiation factor IF-2 [bacterium]MBU1984971.1 translation initiation factor IF-2 [bacterium]
MPAEKPKKVYQVAKELNVATPAIVEFLEDHGFDVPKKHMSPLTPDMYEEIIRKFDPARWQKKLEEETRVLDDAKRAEAERARAEQSLKILDEITHKATEAAETLIRQVQEQRDERTRKIEQEVEQQEELRRAEERKLTDEEERARKEAEEKARREAERAAEAEKAEAERREKERKAAEAQKRRAKPAAPEARKPKKREPEKPAAEAVAKKPVKPLVKPKDVPPRKPRATKEDIEALEKQKKLLAAQKAEKYRKTVVQPGRDASSRRRQRRKKVDQREVEATIRQTLASMETTGKRRRRRERGVETAQEEDGKLRLTEFVTNQELANLMGVEVNEVIAKFLSMGKLVSINQRLDKDLIELIADEFGYAVEFVSTEDEEEIEVPEESAPEDLAPRPPVVTVMGHVDHGKTSLLDYLRKTSVIAGESGGITQHIGAYSFIYKNRKITFLDTPGHEAFTAMRARGAQGADIVILVVAADDHVRPQTIEAINHAQSAGVPIVVAINKIDKPDADPERIRKELAEKNLLVEQWGGKIQSAEISAKFGNNIDALLEEVLLAADILELKANHKMRARGTVIESRLDKGRGILATVLMIGGTLRVGDNFVAGQQYGKVRALLNEFSETLPDALPGDPVQVVGFSGAPQAGDAFVVFESEREVREIAMRRQLLQREQTFRQIRTMSLDQISARIREGGIRELGLVIKGDADGSVEAICDTLQRLSTTEVGVRIVHKGVGAISESDVLLASATGAIILGFHVHPNIKARELATREHVDIRVYRVIYEMEDDVRNALEGMLAPDTREDVLGLVEVRELFRIPKVGVVLGCFVVSGKVTRTNMVRVLRDGREIWKGKIASLRRFKDDVREVRAGFDCGIGLDAQIESGIGDTLEVFEIVEVKRKLASATP